MTRPTFDQAMMNVARVIAERSTCSARQKVGAVAVRNKQIISTGYNGTPRGIAHCDDIGCQRLPDGKHISLIHAEENVVANAAREGFSLMGAVLYVTISPCSHCAGMLIQAGFKEVIIGHVYGDTWPYAEVLLMMDNIKVTILEEE